MFSKLGQLIPGRGRPPETRLRQALDILAAGWSLEAFRRLQQCAEEGLADAQFALAQRYELAQGVVQNLGDAAHWYALAAAQDHIGAQSRLGELLLAGSTAASATLDGQSARLDSSLGTTFAHGVTLTPDPVAALRWNRSASAAGDLAARVRLGRQYALGLGVETDLDEARSLLRSAAEANDPTACTAYGVLLAGGYGGPEQPALARDWLVPRAEAGDALAQFWLGIVLSSVGEQGVNQPTATPPENSPTNWLLRAAAQGLPEAMHQLGLAYWSGREVERDIGQAETWLRRAAAKGVSDAMRGLAQLLLEQPNDDGIEAANLLWQAADTGDRRAAALLGELYLRGHGLPRDSVEAARWLATAGEAARPQAMTALASLQAATPLNTRHQSSASDWLRAAAERGDLAATFTLGTLYQRGEGVPSDPAAAAAHFSAAAEGGSSNAAFYLALLLADDNMPAHDLTQAIRWFRQAAQAGHAVAVCNLALLTLHGRGMPADPARAVAMLETSAAQGNAAAAELLAEWYCTGEHLQPAPERARELLMQALQLGSAKAAKLIVQARLQGVDWQVDWPRVRSLLVQTANSQDSGAAEAAHAMAQLESAGLDASASADESTEVTQLNAPAPDREQASSSVPFTPTRLTAALPWWRKAAEGGVAEAQAWMGDYQRSAGIPPEGTLSAEMWYRKAAQQGHLGALTAYAGALQARGTRVEEDERQLFGLWLAAAQRGHPVAQRQVAHCYLEGLGCKAYPQAALRWLASAAATGDAEAQYVLACSHRDGRGTRRDAALARLWFERAARQKHPAAIRWVSQNCAPSGAAGLPLIAQGQPAAKRIDYTHA